MTGPRGQIKIGYQAILHCHNAQVPVKIVSIQEVLQRKSAEEEKNQLYKWDRAIVVFSAITCKLGIDLHRRCAKLGRFVLREGHSIIGAGLVTETTVADYFK